MCRSIAQGGLRCASHARARFHSLTPAIGQQWDDAAADYAATKEGFDHLLRDATVAALDGNFEHEARIRSAITQGQARKAAAEEIAERSRTFAQRRRTTGNTHPDGTWVAGSPIPDVAHISAHHTLTSDRLRQEIATIDRRLGEQENSPGVHDDLRSRRTHATLAMHAAQAREDAADAAAREVIDSHARGRDTSEMNLDEFTTMLRDASTRQQ